jgi:hypothetical protein
VSEVHASSDVRGEAVGLAVCAAERVAESMGLKRSSFT